MKKVIISWGLILFLGPLYQWSDAQKVKVQMPGCHPEADYFKEKGVLYSTMIKMGFRTKVLDPARGVVAVDENLIPDQYSSLKMKFAEIKNRWGRFQIVKSFPESVWGDTLELNHFTGAMVRVPDLSQMFRLLFDSLVPIDSVIKELDWIPEVEYVSPPTVFVDFSDPNDPSFGQQWELQAIGAPQAWTITKGDPNVLTAIVDGGQSGNPDLAGKIAGGDGLFYCCGYHGTEVAGVMCAATDNGVGMASLGWNLRMLTYLQGIPSGLYAYYANSIRTAKIQGARVINISWGCFIWSDEDNCENHYDEDAVAIPMDDIEVNRAVTTVQGVGAVCVAAYGNKSKNDGLIPNPACDPCKVPFQSYPAQYATIAVAGTKQDSATEDYIPGYNNGQWVTVAAPSWGVTVLQAQPPYYRLEAGTSFGAPQVAALVGLMLSTNPALTPNDVKSILMSTADKVGTIPYVNGRNDYLGNGRINAYQALLLSHAHANKSTSSQATAFNGQRKIYRESSGTLHEVFESGGEIFYRLSTDGVTWQTPKRLSDGTGLNSAPCISARYTYYAPFIYVIWQKSNGSNWDIVYNYNTYDGAPGSWLSNPVTLVSSLSCPSPGPTPSICCSTQGSTIEQLSAWRESSQLKYARTTNAYPTSPSAWSIGGVPQTNSSSANPSIGAGTLSKFVLTWDESGQIYTEFTYFGGGWSGAKVNISSGAYMVSNKKNPSIAFTSSGDQYVAWEGIYSAHSSIVTNLNQGSVYWMITDWSHEFQGATVTGNNDTHANVAWWDNSNTSRYVQLIAGTPQSIYTLGSSLKYPSLSVSNPGGGVARCLATSTSGPPYALQLSSQNFQKALDLPLTATKAIVSLVDKDENGVAYVEVGNARIQSETGGSRIITFCTSNLYAAGPEQGSPAEIVTASFTPTGLTDSITFDLYLDLPQPNNALIGTSTLTCELVSSKTHNALFAVFANNLVNAGENSPTTTINVPCSLVSAESWKDSAYLRISISGIPLASGILDPFIILVCDLSRSSGDAEKIVELQSVRKEPLEYSMVEAYPNPFNPSTMFRYALPVSGRASLIIYDVLGREIAVVVNEYCDAGYHSTTWNASNVASGVYFARLNVTNEYGAVKFTKVNKLLLMK